MAKKKKKPTEPNIKPVKEQVSALLCLSEDMEFVILHMDEIGLLMPLFGVNCGPAEILEGRTGVKLVDDDFKRIAVIEEPESTITYYMCSDAAVRTLTGEARLVGTKRLGELMVDPTVKWLVPMVQHDPCVTVLITREIPMDFVDAGDEEFEKFTDADNSAAETEHPAEEEEGKAEVSEEKAKKEAEA